MCALANKDLTASGCTFQSRRHIYGVAHDRVTHPQIVTHVTGDYCSRVDADMEGQRLLQLVFPSLIESFQPLPHRNGSPQSALSVVFQRYRRTEYGHDAIANELIDHAFVLINGVNQVFQTIVHNRGELFWV